MTYLSHTRKHKRKILVIGSYAESLRSFRGALLDALVASGAEVHAAAPNVPQEMKEYFSMRKITVHDIRMDRTGTNPLKDIATFFSIYKLILKLKPTNVLAYTIKPVVYGLSAAKLARVKNKVALITGLGYAFTEERKGLLSKIATELYRFTLKSCEHIFFQNPDDKNLFCKKGLISNRQSVTVVNGSGVDTQEFAVTPLPSDGIHFLMIARLLGDKGTREYIEAASSIKQRYPQVTFHLVGWIDENPDSISQAELDNWIAKNIIHFWGKLNDVRPAITNSSVYVLPSYREGTPRTVLEAMSMGRAVITTDAPGCRETVINNENGFLVPIRSSMRLIEAMEQFLKEPILIHSMGQASRKIVEQKYEINKINQAMLSKILL